MTDRELYNYIKDNYKPEKDTSIFFDLRNYHICGLQPRILHSQEELIFNCLAVEKEDQYAFVDNVGGQIRSLFSYKEIFIFENLCDWQNYDFEQKIEIDITPYREQIEAAVDKMIVDLIILKKTQGS